jgi:hypothetical protein
LKGGELHRVTVESFTGFRVESFTGWWRVSPVFLNLGGELPRKLSKGVESFTGNSLPAAGDKHNPPIARRLPTSNN